MEIDKQLPESYSALYKNLKENYGDYSQEEIKTHVEQEGWMLYEAVDGTTGVRTDRGVIVRGSSPIARKRYSYHQALQDFRMNVVDMAQRSNAIEEFFNGLMVGVKASDPRALMIFQQIFLGRAPDVNPADSESFYERRAIEQELRRLTQIRHEDGSYSPAGEDWTPLTRG